MNISHNSWWVSYTIYHVFEVGTYCVCYCACLLLWQQITISTLRTRLIAASLGEGNVPEESDEKRLLPPAALDPASSHGHCIWLRLWSR